MFIFFIACLRECMCGCVFRRRYASFAVSIVFDLTLPHKLSGFANQQEAPRNKRFAFMRQLHNETSPCLSQKKYMYIWFDLIWTSHSLERGETVSVATVSNDAVSVTDPELANILRRVLERKENKAETGKETGMGKSYASIRRPLS